MTADRLDIILAHYKSPKNFGCMESPDVVVEGLNALCGDTIRLQLGINKGVIENAMFQGDACAITTAAASILTERVKHVSTADALGYAVQDLVADLGGSIPAARTACVELPLKLFREALEQAKSDGGNGSRRG